jgi:hypothetical protein
MKWYEKVLKKNKKEIIAATTFSLVFALMCLLRHFFTGQSFHWETISPVEAPGLMPRLFYSALVYITLGAFLLYAGFYKFLYSLFRGTRGGYGAYKDTKGLIWRVLILVMYFIIIPAVVKILNSVISFAYNVLNLTLYLSPSFGISLVITTALYLTFIYVSSSKDR